MMPPFITAQSIYFASLGAENNPLDRALGKLAGIGGGGDALAPLVAGFDFFFEDRFAAMTFLLQGETIPSFTMPQVIMRAINHAINLPEQQCLQRIFQPDQSK
jgi:hypothetical protein